LLGQLNPAERLCRAGEAQKAASRGYTATVPVYDRVIKQAQETDGRGLDRESSEELTL
jgi:hypothetical protein